MNFCVPLYIFGTSLIKFPTCFQIVGTKPNTAKIIKPVNTVITMITAKVRGIRNRRS
ncbi:Uncharacterised protein [Vibrio cholerae]|uniref:Uncharacterized protein n=1 Tax=Vibrio cholerae TaxID=666 RepID=A0A655ZVI6_VIBCL|nr:Uncharacterised protein [Vibrio cholerae]CSA36794.1 Uncharacterised protein [Vibrio cholerae]CSB22989.1 Uncharacterised protein [Vibrio cholerae]CSB66372.1 Uncharacterised protein [Vibrio cholerae]CSC77724.1 Uncharacterised protein [Vibrio cholerae]